MDGAAIAAGGFLAIISYFLYVTLKNMLDL